MITQKFRSLSFDRRMRGSAGRQDCEPRPAAGFVQALHRDVLGRGATRLEVAAALEVIAHGSRGEYVDSIASTEDALARVVDVQYAGFLHRQPSQAERQSCIASLRCGEALDRIIADLLVSREYRAAAVARGLGIEAQDAYISAVYLDLLRRLPSSAEIAHAGKKIVGDCGPFVIGLLRGEEFRAAFMRALYRQLLDREPAPNELLTYVVPGNCGIDLQQARLNILRSSEYFNRWN